MTGPGKALDTDKYFIIWEAGDFLEVIAPRGKAL